MDDSFIWMNCLYGWLDLFTDELFIWMSLLYGWLIYTYGWVVYMDDSFIWMSCLYVSSRLYGWVVYRFESFVWMSRLYGWVVLIQEVWRNVGWRNTWTVWTRRRTRIQTSVIWRCTTFHGRTRFHSPLPNGSRWFHSYRLIRINLCRITSGHYVTAGNGNQKILHWPRWTEWVEKLLDRSNSCYIFSHCTKNF